MNAGFSNLTTLKARVMPRELATKTEYDETVRSIGLGVACQFSTRANRAFGRVVETVEEHGINGQVIPVHHFPIESVTTVTFLEAGHPEGDTETFTPDRIAEESGLVYIPYWARRNDTIKVTYTGGYWWDKSEDGSETLPTGAAPLPDDLFDAWISQVQAVLEARNIFGGQATGENLKQEVTTRDVGFLEYVAEVVASYRRL